MQLSNCWENLNHVEFCAIIAKKVMLGVFICEKMKSISHSRVASSCKLFLLLILISCRRVAWYLEFLNYIDSFVYCHIYTSLAFSSVAL